MTVAAVFKTGGEQLRDICFVHKLTEPQLETWILLMTSNFKCLEKATGSRASTLVHHRQADAPIQTVSASFARTKQLAE